MFKISSILIFALAIIFIVIIGVVIALAISKSKNCSVPTQGEYSYFDGSTLQLIGYNLLSIIVCTITLSIAYPWMLCMKQRWQTKHTVIHGRRLKFTGHGHQLVGKYLLWLFLTIITFGIYGIWLGLSVKKWVVKHTIYADEDTAVKSYFSGGAGGFIGTNILALLLTVVTLGIGKAWADKMVLSWEAKHTHIGGSPLEFYGKGGQLFGKYLLFILLTPLTLGIYAIFFPVNLMKWQIKNTEAVYQTPEIQAKARAHEASAVSDFAKYRIAANDQEIAAMKSGYTGNEDIETLKSLAQENNPFAAYKLAVLTKGESEVFEGDALELLQKAAEAKHHNALLDLAKQLQNQQKIQTLIEAAQHGNAEACWLLVIEYKKQNNLEKAAYWFRVSLEWEIPDAIINKADYERIIKNIALQLSENRPIQKKSTAMAVVLGVVGSVFVVLIAGAIMLFLGITPRFGEAQSTGFEVNLVADLNESETKGEVYNISLGEDEELEYRFNEDVFYDTDKGYLYFEFGKLNGAEDIFLLFTATNDDESGPSWLRTDPLSTIGIYKIRINGMYLFYDDFAFSVHSNYGGNPHALNIIEGTTEEAYDWLEEEYDIKIN